MVAITIQTEKNRDIENTYYQFNGNDSESVTVCVWCGDGEKGK
jgi:hypothetical protein